MPVNKYEALNRVAHVSQDNIQLTLPALLKTAGADKDDQQKQ
jgi:hypothetical protein